MKKDNLLADFIYVYDKYIKLLRDKLNETVGIAHVHGWRSSRYKEGVKLRKKITKLKEMKDKP